MIIFGICVFFVQIGIYIYVLYNIYCALFICTLGHFTSFTKMCSNSLSKEAKEKKLEDDETPNAILRKVSYP